MFVEKPEDRMNGDRAVRALAALAHDTRLALFRMLVERGPDGLPAGVIAERLGVPPSSLTFHVQHLHRAGLVTQRRLGRQLIYAANFAAMNGLVGIPDGELLRSRGTDDGLPARGRNRATARQEAIRLGACNGERKPAWMRLRSRTWCVPATAASPPALFGMAIRHRAAAPRPRRSRRANPCGWATPPRNWPPFPRAPISASAAATRRRSPRCGRARPWSISAAAPGSIACWRRGRSARRAGSSVST